MALHGRNLILWGLGDDNETTPNDSLASQPLDLTQTRCLRAWLAKINNHYKLNQCMHASPPSSTVIFNEKSASS